MTPFECKLSWASQTGIWPHEAVAAVFGIGLSQVKNAATGRYRWHRDHVSFIRTAPYRFAKLYVPRWLFAALDKGERVPNEDLNAPAQDTPDKNEILDAFAEGTKTKPDGTRKFNDIVRNGVLLEAVRIDDNGGPYWSNREFAAALGLTVTNIEGFRNGSIDTAFHTRFRSARAEYLRTHYGEAELTVLDVPVLSLASAVEYEQDVLIRGQDRALRRWEAAASSHRWAMNALGDDYRHQLVFDALRNSDRYADEFEVSRKLRVRESAECRSRL